MTHPSPLPTDEELMVLLSEVAERGGPAQRASALELASRGVEGALPPGWREDVVHLVDAYRNDPYLWK